nr:hypothetical protein CFP56_78739 [Quercus suber]
MVLRPGDQVVVMHLSVARICLAMDTAVMAAVGIGNPCRSQVGTLSSSRHPPTTTCGTTISTAPDADMCREWQAAVLALQCAGRLVVPYVGRIL